ncbi:hypothetical protein [Stenotrophomonas sp. 24(2023)]|uniref:hypothetical protein n=1 Tax=Stenotrophomonas sp. 24(2023) TaxID=3068324 RepID=UPI0027E0394E|nr:hypothetical protein [Stenotrophomonas sp. 24(2023)]WMJ69981.1 hypothetical protein Q9R17_02420 [Stenotrophomonas sp. 24(2023)]
MLLGKAQILQAQDRRHQDVAVPEWGGMVRVAMMSASDRDRWEQDTYGGDTPKVEDFRARFVGLCLVDEQGARLFSDGEVAQLGAKSAAALDRVFRVAQTLNALGEAAIGELEKN